MRRENRRRGGAGLAAGAALLLTACAPGPLTGHSGVSDGVKFDYVLAAPADGAKGPYHLTLNLADAGTGAPITDASVAVNVTGPGVEGDSLVNLHSDAQRGYDAEVPLPQSAAYHLTFQVNRHTMPGARAVFVTNPPAAGA